MMKIQSKAFVGAVMALSLLSFRLGNAATIIKLSLSDTDPDVQYAGGVLSTINDGNVGTTGDQDTDILFLDFLGALPAISNGSYTLSGSTAFGPAVLSGPIVTQAFTGGNFKIWDAANVKLLDVNMGSSLLAGGPSPAGAFFNITNGTIIGGTLAPLIVSSSINMSMSLTDISGGQLLAPLNVLQAFTADASKSIAGDPVPEPTTAVLVILGGIAAWACGRRRS